MERNVREDSLKGGWAEDSGRRGLTAHRIKKRQTCGADVGHGRVRRELRKTDRPLQSGWSTWQFHCKCLINAPQLDVSDVSSRVAQRQTAHTEESWTSFWEEELSRMLVAVALF
jgi:hypothetical protein